MPILFTLLAVPLVGMLILLFVPGKQAVAVRVISIIVSAIALALSLWIFFSYNYSLAGYQLDEKYPWLEGIGVSLHLAVDGISVPMLLLTGIVMFTGSLISWKIKDRNKEFFVLFMSLVAGVYGVFLSLDLFFLFFFYELAVLPMYLLIGVWGSSSRFPTFSRSKEYSAMKLTLYLVAGSVLIWVGLIAVYVQANTGSFDLLALQKTNFPKDFQNLFLPFFLVGFGVLAGLWPFHTWSPDGHVAAPTAVSMLHAGVLMKLGAYGIVRVGMTLFPQATVTWMPVIIVLATINVIYGAISAMGQRDLKYVIGYSSVSHMGYVLMGFATLNPVGINGAVLQMFSHGIMTALFFALVGSVYDQAHTRDITIFEGLAKRMSKVGIFFTVAGLASLGLPGLSGFVAEFLVFVGAFQTYPFIGVLGVIGATITAVYILRLLAKVFFGPLDSRWEKLVDATRAETVAMAILVFTLIFVGVYPTHFMKIIDSGVHTLIGRLAG